MSLCLEFCEGKYSSANNRVKILGFTCDGIEPPRYFGLKKIFFTSKEGLDFILVGDIIKVTPGRNDLVVNLE